jgi:hypothetical protein
MFTILCSISVRAQSSPDGPGPEELIQRLQKRIDQLEASQKVMQEKIDYIGSAPPAAQAPEAPATPATETVETQPEAPLAHVLGPVQLHGFSDIDYGRAWFEKLPPGGLKGSTNSHQCRGLRSLHQYPTFRQLEHAGRDAGLIGLLQ